MIIEEKAGYFTGTHFDGQLEGPAVNRELVVVQILRDYIHVIRQDRFPVHGRVCLKFTVEKIVNYIVVLVVRSDPNSAVIIRTPHNAQLVDGFSVCCQNREVQGNTRYRESLLSQEREYPRVVVLDG